MHDIVANGSDMSAILISSVNFMKAKVNCNPRENFPVMGQLESGVRVSAIFLPVVAVPTFRFMVSVGFCFGITVSGRGLECHFSCFVSRPMLR